MKLEMYLRFPEGLPRTTSQEKGEAIRYKFVGGRKVPFIDHYRKPEVQAHRNRLIYMMKRYKPEKPSEKCIKLMVVLYFDIKEKKKWGKFKNTKPDCDNYVKEIKDVMTVCGFWNDDNQVVDLRVIKYYAEQATIYIRMEELDDEPAGKQTT